MTASTEHQTDPARPKHRGPDTAASLLIGCMMLCPLSKVVTLAAAGGLLGGLLGMPWLLIITGIAIAGSSWALIRRLRSRATSCRSRRPGGRS